jgi:hypothetical protein
MKAVGRQNVRYSWRPEDATWGTPRYGSMVSLVAIASVIVVAGVRLAAAQYSTGFEAPAFSGSPAGVMLNGQNGFYNPLPLGSVSAQVYSYAGNALGMPTNPNGGGQFASGIGPADGTNVRSQLDIPFGSGRGMWVLEFDFAVAFAGQPPAAPFIGGLSTQPIATAAAFNVVAAWSDPSTATSWKATGYWFDATGTVLEEDIPAPGFQSLMLNHWYRWATTFDCDTNRIVRVTLTDLTTATAAIYEPTDRYLGGAPPAHRYRRRSVSLSGVSRVKAATSRPSTTSLCIRQCSPQRLRRCRASRSWPS